MISNNGWRSRLCRDERYSEGPRAEQALGAVRAWKLPEGESELPIYYPPPLWTVARI